MAIVTGTISSVKDQWGKWNINVNGNWYSTKQEWWKGAPPEEGQEVSFDDGGRNFIKNFKVTGSAPAGGSAPAPAAGGGNMGGGQRYQKTFPIAALDPARAINRQNALTNSVNFHSGQDGVDADQIIHTARLFEAYTTGDLDEEEVKAAMAAMGG